ncbi:uncharacterized protein LOC107633193 [Arachis ipaensis]|uniref:uncharacterized protein LOC107633193 n=1 Tax=Arachis ipaensis TaxID=130454 RepID=UPI0007AFA98D|nr:uncharacterized protein LOC107633193 [Arachis ipaensis]XP_025640414.1 uncharacterized protein LOC112735058 [Arachis hypogaea]
MEKGKAVAQSSGIDKHKDVDVDEEYFDEGDDDMVGTISIIPTKYLGECKSNPDEDYDQEDEEVFSSIRIEDEPSFFPRPTERQMSHLRPLHIVAVVNGFKINKVLIDGGVAISLLPKRMLGKVRKHVNELVPTNIAVTDFSGNSTPARGLVTLTIKVGSSERHYVFVVVPSKASYNALLGRDWNHGVGAVPSTMHQSVLLWTEEGKPEIVKADSSQYVEQMHVDFRIYNCKLKPFNVDRSLNPYNYEGCYLTSEGLSVKLRYPDLVGEPTGLDRSLVEHRLALKLNARPVKQTPRRFAPEINVKIKEEIECLIKEKFIRTARYVEWVSNIVPMMTKNEKLRVCIDFCDLNNATPKDEYFMPIVDMLIDSAAGNEILSFMDGYYGYNQIFIVEDDVAKTAFRCPGALGTYEWVVMPFGLKNAGAMYQRVMNAIFHEFIGRFMEVYIDDVMVKSISVSQHIGHLRKAFLTMRKKGLKMNLLKCAFGVSAGNFLGFVVHKKGIAIDKNKEDAILALSAPKSKKEVQSFLGKIKV